MNNCPSASPADATPPSFPPPSVNAVTGGFVWMCRSARRTWLPHLPGRSRCDRVGRPHTRTIRRSAVGPPLLPSRLEPSASPSCRIASHPFSRSLAPRVRCKTLLLPDVLRRWSSDHFLTLCDGSPELMGASGGGPDPPMAPGCSPASEMSPSPSPSPPPPPQPSRVPPLPNTSPPQSTASPFPSLLLPPPSGTTSAEAPYPAACKSPRRHCQPEAHARGPWRGDSEGPREPRWRAWAWDRHSAKSPGEL